MTTDSGSLYVAAMPKEATFVRLDPEIKRALVRLAQIDGRSLSALIAKIASDWIKAQKIRK